jgi:hypothetical protein
VTDAPAIADAVADSTASVAVEAAEPVSAPTTQLPAAERTRAARASANATTPAQATTQVPPVDLQGDRLAPGPRSADYPDGRAGDFRIGDPRPGTPPRPADPRASDGTRRTADLQREDRRPPRPGEGRPAPAVYRARRPGVAAGLIIPAVLVSLLLIRALAISAFGNPFLIGGVIASCLALAAVPLLVAGLYGLMTGAAYGAEHAGFRLWAKPPLAYLVVGIGFAIAAGIAIA